MLPLTIPGAAGSRVEYRIVELGNEVAVVVVMVSWMRPRPGYHTTAAMTMAVRVELCREVAKLDSLDAGVVYLEAVSGHAHGTDDGAEKRVDSNLSED